jgi:hypothetical protein
MKALSADAITSQSGGLWMGVPRFMGESAFGEKGEEEWLMVNGQWLMDGRRRKRQLTINH